MPTGNRWNLSCHRARMEDRGAGGLIPRLLHQMTLFRGKRPGHQPTGPIARLHAPSWCCSNGPVGTFHVVSRKRRQGVCIMNHQLESVATALVSEGKGIL